MKYSNIHEKWFKTPEDQQEQDTAFMHEVEESNKDMHDNCDMNSCKACVGD